MRFTKMHGCGNDYVYVNCFEETVASPEKLAPAVSDRHFGIGSDGFVLICPSKVADVRMRMFNLDGSEAQMCGNALRCVAKYTYDHKLANAGGSFPIPGQGAYPASLRIETGRGVLSVGLEVSNGVVTSVCVNMGEPILEPANIPVAIKGERAINSDIDVDGQRYQMTCVSMGNPHAVIFCDDVNAIDLEKIGPKIENHPLFPQRVNVHFVHEISRSEFAMRTWERGCGITLACGTGACACGVAAVLTGRCERQTLVHLPGGDLRLNWCEQDNCVYMTGPATEVFTGEWLAQI